MSGAALRVARVAALFALVGVLAGVVWELIWTPPQGVAISGQFVLTSEGLSQTFSGTALYAVVALVAGVVLGAVVALVQEGSELLTLLAVAVGGFVAAPVMALVGTWLGPDDADAAARDLPDNTLVEQELRVEGVGAYLAFPSGALLAVGGVFLSLARREDEPSPASGTDDTGPRSQ